MNALRYLAFVPRVLLPGAGGPLHLTLFVTARCPYRCAHCFYHREVDAARAEAELSLAEIERLAQGCGPLLWLALTGGEPFLRGDLPQIAAAFARHSRPRHLSIVSSGQSPARIARDLPRILAAAPQSYVQFNLSIDGPAPVHDRLRGSAGALERALQSAAVVRRLKPAFANLGLGVATTFNTGARAAMPELLALIRDEVRPDHWDIAMVRRPARDPAVICRDTEAFLRWKARIEPLFGQRVLPYYRYPLARFGLARHLEHNRFVAATLRRPGYRLPCQAGRLSAVVYPDGAVAACESRDLVLGQLRRSGYHLGRIFRSAAARRARATIHAERCHCDHGCNLAVNLTFHLPTALRIAGRALGPLHPEHRP